MTTSCSGSRRRLLGGAAILLLACASLLLRGSTDIRGTAVAAVLAGALGISLFLACLHIGGSGPAAVGSLLPGIVRFFRSGPRGKGVRTESDLRMRILVESAPEAIVIFDADTRRFLDANPKAEELFGRSRAQLLQVGLADVSPLNQSDGRPSEQVASAHILEALRGSAPAFEAGLLRADGSQVPCELRLVRLPGETPRLIRGSIADITARKELDRLKEEFVSTVSHELRTPLTSIEASLGLIDSGVAGPVSAAARPLVDIARKNCRRLSRLINDILDSEMIAAGRMRFSFQRLDLRPLLDEAVEANRSYAGRLDVRLRLESSAAGALVEGDPDRLMQVLSNLISNACKYSPRGDVVVVGLEPRFDGWRISVRDNGPGIPESFRSRIFQRFSQADASDVRPQGGTGLGLCISKSIVEKHHGRLGYEAQPGQGSLFFVDLPPWTPSWNERRPAPDVLVCEDDPSVAGILCTLLEREGFGVERAETAADAVAALKRRSFDAMTLDLLLPDRDGLELLRDLRGKAGTAALPVVVVSAAADDHAAELAALEVVDCIEKPIPVQRLLRAVRRAVARRDAKARLLHVEADPGIRAAAAVALGEAAGVVGVATLEDARRELEARAYDLILLGGGIPDVPLPGGIPSVRFDAPPRSAEALLAALAAHPDLPVPLRRLFPDVSCPGGKP